MIVPVKELLITLPVLLLSVFVLGAVGWMASSLLHRKKGLFTMSAIFLYLLTGFCLIISVYAIIITRFRTCLLPVPLLVVFLIKSFPPQVSLTSNSYEIKGKRLIIFVLAAIIIYWSCFAFSYVSFDDQWMKFVSSDINYYGRVACQINSTGVENTALDYLGLSPSPHQPYHYGDVWLIAFFVKVTGFHPTIAASLCAYPFLALLFACGLTVCINACLKQYLSYKQQAVIIVSVLANALLFLYPFLLGGTGYMLSLIVYPKLLIPAILFTGLISSVHDRVPGRMIIFSVLGIFLYTPIAPAFAFISAILFCFWLYKNTSIIKTSLSYILVSAVSLGYLYWFYYMNDFANYYNFSNPGIHSDIAVSIILRTPLQLVPLIPYFLILFYSLNENKAAGIVETKKNRQFLLLSGLLFVGGALSYVFLYTFTIESLQFFTNILSPVCCIFIGYSLVMALAVPQKLLHLVALGILLISIYLNGTGIYWTERMKRNDLENTRQFLEKNGTGRFVSLKSVKELSGFIGVNTEYDLPLHHIDFLQKSYFNIILTTHGLIVDSSNVYHIEEQTLLDRSAYSQYVEKNMKKVPEKEMMLSFLRNYHIRYFCVSPDTTLPASIRPLVIDSVGLENRWSIFHINP